MAALASDRRHLKKIATANLFRSPVGPQPLDKKGCNTLLHFGGISACGDRSNWYRPMRNGAYALVNIVIPFIVSVKPLAQEVDMVKPWKSTLAVVAILLATVTSGSAFAQRDWDQRHRAHPQRHSHTVAPRSDVTFGFSVGAPAYYYYYEPAPRYYYYEPPRYYYYESPRSYYYDAPGYYYYDSPFPSSD